MRDRIIEMLGKGIPATQVASAVGCEDSYISQLLSEENILEQVTQLKAEHFSKYVRQDQLVDDAEALALEKMTNLLQYVTKPTEAARVFAVLNAAKRRTVDTINSAVPLAATVMLDLPEAARVRFTITQDKQVIEIEGRSMTTMPASSIAARLEQRTAARLLTTDVPTTLPLNMSSMHIKEVTTSIAKAI